MDLLRRRGAAGRVGVASPLGDVSLSGSALYAPALSLPESEASLGPRLSMPVALWVAGRLSLSIPRRLLVAMVCAPKVDGRGRATSGGRANRPWSVCGAACRVRRR